MRLSVAALPSLETELDTLNIMSYIIGVPEEIPRGLSGCD
jgi:hypothetical protein